MEQWQDAASRQAELLTHRLNELLSRGLELLRTELGVDLGLKPDLIPPWVILLAACTGLVLMVALWASVCRGLFQKRPAHSPVDDGIEVTRGVSKPVKPEDPKKKKKKAEKARKPSRSTPFSSSLTVRLTRLAVMLTSHWQLQLAYILSPQASVQAWPR